MSTTPKSAPNEVTTLSWWGNLLVSMTRRAKCMPIGVLYSWQGHSCWKGQRVETTQRVASWYSRLGGGGVGVEILTGGVTAGAVMMLFGQSRRDTQRPIGPIISYWNVRTMAEATKVGQVHVAMEMKEYGNEVLGISESRLGHIHCS